MASGLSEVRRFDAVIKATKQRTYIPLPFDPAYVYGDLDRYCLRAYVNGRILRGQPKKYGTEFGIACGPVWLRDNHFESGNRVSVEIGFEEPHSESVAMDLRIAFENDPVAKRMFDSHLSSCRKAFLGYVDEAKRDETRQKRIQQVVEMLRNSQLPA